MHKPASFLMVLLIIIAYGRCVADQLGVLHASGNACCQVVCDTDDHCEKSDADQHGDHSASNDPVENSDDPIPCQLCLILSNDSIQTPDIIKIPTPTIIEIDPDFFRDSLINLLSLTPPTLVSELSLEGSWARPVEHSSRIKEISIKTTPVRGPSFV